MRQLHGAAVTLVGAAPLATWLLIGQLREGNGVDFIFRMPEMNRTLEVSAGLGALSLAAGVGSWLSQHGRDWLSDEGWWRVYGRLLAAGLMVAVGARIVTAASMGANIGGGFALMFGPLPVFYLLLRARDEAVLLTSPSSPPGWRPPAVEWLLAGGSGVALTTVALMCAGFLAIVLIPTPALAVIGAVAMLVWLVGRNR